MYWSIFRKSAAVTNIIGSILLLLCVLRYDHNVFDRVVNDVWTVDMRALWWRLHWHINFSKMQIFHLERCACNSRHTFHSRHLHFQEDGTNIEVPLLCASFLSPFSCVESVVPPLFAVHFFADSDMRSGYVDTQGTCNHLTIFFSSRSVHMSHAISLVLTHYTQI